jgi:hypothetical protein
MSIPPTAAYFDTYFGACEPCFSKVIAGNQCVYMTDVNGGDYSWIDDDDDINQYPDKPCKDGQVYDHPLRACRPLCPGEGAGGQSFIYMDDNKGGVTGECGCEDPDNFTFDEATQQCVPSSMPAPPASLRQLRAGGVEPGTPFGPCHTSKNGSTNCYYPSMFKCEEAFGMNEQVAALRSGNMMLRGAMPSNCPYLVCKSTAGAVSNGQFTVPRDNCMCISESESKKMLDKRKKRK